MVNNDLLKLVRAICPDFPEDKQVKSSHDQFSWFKIINATNTLIVPPINYIRSNVLILDKTVEAITAFSISETDASEFDWDNLNLYEAHTPADILRMIDTVRKVAQGKEIGVDIETRRVEWEDNELTRYAVKVAILNGAYTINYIDAIIYNWQKLGIKSVSQAQEETKRHRDKKISKKTDYIPEWFDADIKKEEVETNENNEMEELLKDFK